MKYISWRILSSLDNNFISKQLPLDLGHFKPLSTAPFSSGWALRIVWKDAELDWKIEGRRKSPENHSVFEPESLICNQTFNFLRFNMLIIFRGVDVRIFCDHFLISIYEIWRYMAFST